MRLAITLTALLLSGCAAYTPRYDQTAKPGASDAFIYGRFAIDAKSAPLGLDGHNSMGFSLQCRDGSNYILRFYNAKPVHVIKLQPSTCSLTEIIFSNVDGIVRSRKPYTGSLLQNVEFRPGTGYYVGDYFAVADVRYTGSSTLTSWRVTDARSNYPKTTEDMKLEYTGLKDLKTEDLTRRLVARDALPDYAGGRRGGANAADMLDELPLPK